MSALLVLQASGWFAALVLLGALAATPLGRLTPRARVARRPLGIAAALAALVHGALALSIYLGDDAWQSLRDVTWLRSGALALALLMPLLATSFPAVVRRLGVRAWKPLHRLAYAAAALVVHHAVLAPFAPRAWVLGFGVVLVALGLARFLPRRRDRMVADP